MESKALKPHQSAILAAAAASLAIWAIPPIHPLLLPVTYLDTHLHELSHALAGLATGGQPEKIVVEADGNGFTPTLGGNVLILASAGYTGASLIGAATIYFSRSEKGARNMLRFLAAILALSMLLWVRGDVVGVVSGIGWIAGLAALSIWLKGKSLVFAAQFLGLQQCLNAIQAVYILLGLSAFTEAHSDASILQDATHIPALFWAILWCAISVALITATLRRAWR